MGPGGKPIPEAVVELRTDALPTAGHIRQGKLVKRGQYEAFVATDADGRLAVKLPKAPTHFDAFISTSRIWTVLGGLVIRNSRSGDPIPLHGRAGCGLVGGRGHRGRGREARRGRDDRPRHRVQETSRRPSANARRREQKTDAAGRWRFDSVPVSMNEVFVEINHPGFEPIRRPLTRGEFGIERGREPVAKVALNRGLTVTGKVIDEAGKPVVGASVRTKFLNNIREAKTGSDGVYRLAGCEPRMAQIVVSAKGRATDMKELRIDSEMGPVDFQMKPGGTVEIRVLDRKGNPVPKAASSSKGSGGSHAYFAFDHVNQYADKNGIWVWNEAPPDEFTADICPPDGMDLAEQPLTARALEYVFRVPDPLVVSGKVFDAVTRQPIKEFRVVPGVRSSESHMNWVESESFSATDGQFQLRETHGYFAYLVRVEADGYQAAVSRNIKTTEGKVTIDFELQKGKDSIAKVFTPRNVPAEGARVALGVAGSQINIQNGEIDDGSTYSTRLETDKAGRCHFPPQSTDFQLIITHPSGYAHIKSPPQWDEARIIHLEPWARVEGTFRIGKTPAANVPITLNVNGRSSYGNLVPSIFPHHDVTTGPDGRFVFDRVIPGRGSIGRRIMFTVNDGADEVTSSCMIAAEFPPGKTVHIDLGGTGRAVIGKLRPPDGFHGKVHWNFASVTAEPDEAEAATRATSPTLMATIDRDGRFRMDDVPDGNYSLSVRFQRDAAGHLWNHRVHVSPTEGLYRQAL